MQGFPLRASWVPSAQEGLESYLDKEGLKGWKNNEKKLQEFYEMPTRKGGEKKTSTPVGF